VDFSRLAIENCAIAILDPGRAEHLSGHLIVEDDRIVAVDAGPAPEEHRGGTIRIDGSGCLITLGFVNCHHHLYRWATRGLAQQATLFEWLVELYPVWALIDEETEHAAARAGRAALALSGCATTTDHHYVFPRGAGDLLEVEVEAARGIGLRFHPCRGSMDLGRSRGRLPPDEVVEDRDEILSASEEAIERFHDSSSGSMLRIALAPCSPFSVTRGLMAEVAGLARKKGVRLHTHLAETEDEEMFCLERFGFRPLEYLEDLGWLGSDVWLAHCIHLTEEEVRRFGETGTGVAHCPSSNARLGAGIALVAQLARGLPRGPRRGRRGFERGRRARYGAARSPRARPPGGRAGGANREGGAGARHHSRRPLSGAGDRARLAGSWEARRRRPVARRRPRPRRYLRPCCGARLRPRAARRAPAGRRPVVRGAELRTADEGEIAKGIAVASRRLAQRAEVLL
jgi:cytosine/adenosine deaminase-related metal-dependent hydrolase